MRPSNSSTLGALLIAVLSTQAIAGPENSFCGGEKGRFPGQQDCLDAIAKINPDETYTDDVRFDAGNCTVEKRGNGATSVPDGISGRDLINQATDIVTDGCQGSGWCRDSFVNVTVHLCEVRMNGLSAVCNAPRRREIDVAPPLRPKSDKLAERAHLARAARRQSSPEPGVTCGATIGPVDGEDCIELADSLRGKTLPLPYISSRGDCNLAIFAHFQTIAVSGDTVADRIAKDTEGCASTDGSVGRQTDTTQEVPLIGYTIWFGNLCGDFGFGIANCVP